MPSRRYIAQADELGVLVIQPLGDDAQGDEEEVSALASLYPDAIYFEVIVPPSIPNPFKVGDKVKLIAPPTCRGNPHPDLIEVGEIGTVTEIDTDGTTQAIYLSSGYETWLDNSVLNLVEPEGGWRLVSGFHFGPEPPEDLRMAWFDTTPRDEARASREAKKLALKVRSDMVLSCAECGTTEATTYVVTQLDKRDPETRTEVCRRCDDELRHVAPREG